MGDRVGTLDTRMKKCIEVNQNGVLTHCDDVLEAKIDCLQRIQQREISSLPFIKLSNLCLRSATLRCDKLDPPIGATIQDGQRPKGSVSAALIEPSEEFLEVHVYRYRPWLINQLSTRAEPRDQNTSYARMARTYRTMHMHKLHITPLRNQGGSDRLPIGTQMLEKFETK